MAIIYLIIAFILNAFASVFLKYQSLKGLYLKPEFSPKLVTENAYFILAAGFFGLNIIFYTLALSRISLSVANIVMVVMSFLIVTAYSMAVFKEQVTALQVVGYIVIIAGLALAVLSAKA